MQLDPLMMGTSQRRVAGKHDLNGSMVRKHVALTSFGLYNIFISCMHLPCFSVSIFFDRRRLAVKVKVREAKPECLSFALKDFHDFHLLL